MPEEPPLPEEPGGRERVYDIPDEEPPAARPAARPVRKPVAAKSAAVVGDTGKWDAMKEHCKGRLAVNHRVFLNMVQGAVDGDCLTLYCQNEFVRDSLNNNTVLHVLQEVASATEGQSHPGGADGRRRPGREKARQAPVQAGKSDRKSAGEAPGGSPGAGADAPLGGASGGKGPGQAGRGGRPGPPAGKFQNQVIARY